MPSCVAYGCSNGSGKGVARSLHFHRFPFHNPSLLAKWTSVTGRDNWSPSKQSHLCSDHFTPRDYKSPDSGILKETAVPSKFKRLPSSRIKKTEQHSGSKDIINQDIPKVKPQPGRRSVSRPTKDNETAKKGKKDENKHQPVKRKKKEEHEDSLETSPVDDHEETNEISVKSELNSSADWSVSQSCGIQETIEPNSDQSVTTPEESQSRVKAKQTKSARSKAAPGPPKKRRPGKILRLSSDESDNEFEVFWASQRQKVTGANAQIDAGEVLAAVRVELDENEFSDDGQRVNVPTRLMDSGTVALTALGLHSNTVRAAVPLTSSVPNGQNAVAQQRPLCTIPADMDHVVAVNERRTRYRYIYRVGQCFPEEDDDVPFITSKLNFVVKALESQNEKVRALQRKCRELSRSNSTLRDILGIPSTDINDDLLEMEDPEPQQEAFLIIGALPSTSPSLPLYRFTLTDRSPAVIVQANAK